MYEMSTQIDRDVIPSLEYVINKRHPAYEYIKKIIPKMESYVATKFVDDNNRKDYATRVATIKWNLFYLGFTE